MKVNNVTTKITLKEKFNSEKILSFFTVSPSAAEPFPFWRLRLRISPLWYWLLLLSIYLVIFTQKTFYFYALNFPHCGEDKTCLGHLKNVRYKSVNKSIVDQFCKEYLQEERDSGYTG